MSSYRAGGTAVILFGKPQSAFSGRQATEGLDLFKPTSLVRARAGSNLPEHPPGAYEAALTWWVARLNDLVGMALDIGRFSNADGEYQPAAHVGVLLSLSTIPPDQMASIEFYMARIANHIFRHGTNLFLDRL